MLSIWTMLNFVIGKGLTPEPGNQHLPLFPQYFLPFPNEILIFEVHLNLGLCRCDFTVIKKLENLKICLFITKTLTEYFRIEYTNVSGKDNIPHSTENLCYCWPLF